MGDGWIETARFDVRMETARPWDVVWFTKDAAGAWVRTVERGDRETWEAAQRARGARTCGECGQWYFRPSDGGLVEPEQQHRQQPER